MAKYRAYTNDLSSEAVSELISMSGARLVELPDGLPHLRIEPRVGNGLLVENENINAFGHTGVQASRISVKLAAGGGLSFNGSGELQASGVGTAVTVSDDVATNATRYLLFEDVTTGTVSTVNVASTKLTFNPSTGVLAASSLAVGGATTVTGGSVTIRAAATQDAVILAGRAGGTGSFGVTISPTTLTASRTVTLADGNTTLVSGTMYSTSGGTVTGTVTVQAAATQDAVRLQGRAGGTGSFIVSLTPTTLTGSRTVTLADGNTTLVAGTMYSTSGGTITGTVTVQAAATQDAVRLQGRAGGTGSFIVSLIPTTLTASRTVTLADGNTTLVAGTMVPTSRALTITNGTGITGGGAAVDLSANRSWTIGLTGQALALHNLATNGLVARTAEDAFAARTITGTANQVTVTNGDGVAGNPTLSLPADIDITTSLDVGSVGAITAATVRVGGDIRASGVIYATDFVLTGGAGSGVGLTLDDLSGVVITSATINQVLQYNGTNWVNATISTGGGTSVTIADDTSTNGNRYLSFVASTSGTASTLNVSSTKLTFNPSSGVLTTSGGVATPIVTRSTVAQDSTGTLTTSTTTANQVVMTLSVTTYRSAKYMVQATSGSAYQVTEILVVHDGTTCYLTEYGTILTGASLASFNVDISGVAIRLLVTPVNAVTTIKADVTALTV